MSVATEIAAQIGFGLRMIGAKNLTDCGDALRFKIMRNTKKVTHVIVTLTPLDTYTVTFQKKKRAPSLEVIELGVVEDVYAENLKRVIEDGTNLALSLGGRS